MKYKQLTKKGALIVDADIRKKNRVSQNINMVS